MIEEIINLILKYRKKIAIIGGVIILLVFIAQITSNFAIIYIDTHGNIKPKTITTYSHTDSLTQKSLSLGGIHIVPRGTKSVTVAGDDHLKTHVQTSFPWYGYLYKNVTLIRDKTAEKMPLKSTISAQCTTYDPNSDQLLYFECRKPLELTKYMTPSNEIWLGEKIANLYYSDETLPYMGGVIGISPSENTDVKQRTDIVAVANTGRVSFYNTPEEISIESIGRARLFTDTNNPTSNYFIIADAGGDVYLGSPVGNSSEVEYKKIPSPKNYNPDFNQVLCTISGDTATCYYGGIVGEKPADFTTSESITSASFTNETLHSLPVKKKDENNPYGFYATISGELFTKSSNKLYHLKKDKEQYTLDEIAQDVNAVTGGKNLYFIQDNGVYILNLKTMESHQVFYSKKISPKNLYLAADNLFIIGNIEGMGAVTYAYKLLDQDNIEGDKRTIDILPASPSQQLPDTDATDLVGDKLLVQLHLERRNNIDNTILEEKKLSIIEALRARGVDPRKLTFTFVH